MKALWHINNNSSALKSTIQDANGVEIKSLYSMVSTGTERLVARGEVGMDFQKVMSVPYMEGQFDFPIKYGYSLIGHTVDGTVVHTMHPHQDQVWLDEKDFTLVKKNIPPIRATLVSNMETIINAIWDSNPNKNQKIAICGFGNIGSLLATTLRVHYDIEVSIYELDGWRTNKAKELGWKIAKPTDDFDIIYHTTASEQGLQFCLERLCQEGKVIELSWYGNKQIKLSLGKDFHYKRLSIISSQVSVIPQKMESTFNYKTRKELAFQYLKHDSYDDLITHIIPFEESPDFYQQLRTNSQPNGLIWILKY